MSAEIWVPPALTDEPGWTTFNNFEDSMNGDNKKSFNITIEFIGYIMAGLSVLFIMIFGSLSLCKICKKRKNDSDPISTNIVLNSTTETENEADNEAKGFITSQTAASVSATYKKGPFCNVFLVVLIIFYVFMVMLMFVFVLYGLGQITILVIQDFFCENKSISDIHKHSREHNLERGTSIGCWKSKGNNIDEELLFSIDAYSTEYDNSAFNIIKSLIFLCMSMFSLVMFVKHLFGLIDIIVTYINGSILIRTSLETNTDTDCFQKLKKCCCCKNYCDRLSAGFSRFKHQCGFDTLPWILNLFIKEFVEILFQTYILFIYNGKDIIFDSKGTANKDTYIIIFAQLILFNCISVSVLWILYTLLTKYCNRRSFYYSLWMIDITFEMIFILYPILFFIQEFRFNNDSIVKISAIMNTENGLLFVQALFPSILLCKKMYTGPLELLYEIKKKWRSETKDPNEYDVKERYYNDKSCWTLIVNKNELKFINPDSSYRPKNISESKYLKQQRLRKCCLIFLALLVLGFGVGIYAFVMNHFKNAYEFCDNYTEKDHYEMLAWKDYCDYPVYPFPGRNEIPCQCRSLNINHTEIEYLVGKYGRNIVRNIVVDILEHFYMMETIKISGKNNDILPIDLSQDMFNSINMRVFHIEGIKLDNIHPNIKNWENIQYLTIKRSSPNELLLNELNDELSQLTKLKYINLEFFSVGEMAFICSMKELNYLLMGWSAMKSLPFCLLNHELPKLKIIQFDYVEIFDIFGNNSNNETFSYIEKLFTLSSLQELSLFTTPLTLFNFPKNAFNYNPNTQYIFDNTFHLCGYYYRYSFKIYIKISIYLPLLIK